jgi:hypothetical protein
MADAIAEAEADSRNDDLASVEELSQNELSKWSFTAHTLSR